MVITASMIKGGQKEKLGPRKWRIRVSLGRDPKSGKYLKSPSRIVIGTKKDAEEALAEYREELRRKLDHQERDLTFEEYAKDFFRMRESLGESPLSRKSERMEIEKLLQLFGGSLLSDISPGCIKKAYLNASSRYGMSCATIKRISKRLKMILEEAVMDGILDRNPAARIKVAEPQRNPPKPLSRGEAERLVRILSSEDLSSLTVAIRLMLFGGMRKGEVLGLDWGSIDFDHNALFVSKQYSNDRQLRPPKSKNSRRWISLDPETMNILTTWKAMQPAFVNAKLNFIQASDTPIVVNQLGEHTDPTNFNRQFRDFCVRHGFGTYSEVKKYIDKNNKARERRTGYNGLTPHGLRHTHATLLIGANNDMKTVSSRLGHSSIGITLNIYADAIRQNDENAALSIASLLDGKE